MQNMLPGELQELLADIAHIKLQDVHLGRVLETVVTHVAHAHGLDPNASPEEVAPETVATEEEDPSDEEETAPAKPKGKGK